MNFIFRAVLAAASPVLALLLTETVGDEEACLVFADYTHEDIGSLLQSVREIVYESDWDRI